MKITFPSELNPILNEIPKAYLVGGYIRDQLLGLNPKDIDIEIYQMTYEQLVQILSKYGKTDLVGKSFGVVKLSMPDGEVYDFSLARTDSKIDGEKGHKAFKVNTDSFITEKEGASRRDLTINSLMYDPKKDQILDYYGGLNDLKNKVLKHTSSKFVEDPLRVLRVVQFASRFDFDVHPDTIELCKSISHTFNELPKERVGEEFNKMMLKGKSRLKGLRVLSQVDWLKHFPELAALENLPQDPEFHPEGDVLTHTALVCDATANLESWKAMSEKDQLVYMYAGLCHDLGKATTTKVEFKKNVNRKAIVSPGHDIEGVEPTKRLLNNLKQPHDVIKRVVPLVRYHMDHLQVKKDHQIRQLSVNLEPENIEGLAIVIEADHSGRPPLKPELPEEMKYILQRSKELNCNKKKPEPLIQGKDIQEWSKLEPGKIFGIICNEAYSAQIKGTIKDKDSAQLWFKHNRSRIIEQSKLGPPRLFSGNDLIELGFKPGPELGKLHRALYEEQIDGTLNSKKEAYSFIKKNKQKFNVEQSFLNNLKKTITDSNTPHIV